jgi:hypothetical protein
MAPRFVKYQPTHLTPCAGVNGSHSVAWPGIEQPLMSDNDITASLREKLRQLAAGWLHPFPLVQPFDLRQGNEHSFQSGDPVKSCPLVFVRKGLVFVNIRGQSSLFGRDITSCINELAGSFARRLVHVLRFLLVVLARNKDLPDFVFKLCVDDACHGVHEGKALPFFTMVSCGTETRTIPAVQWNTADGRDPDLSLWALRMMKLRHSPGRQNSSWRRRSPKAVWRGALNDQYVMNRDWSKQGSLTRLHLRGKTWKKLGRAALLYQRCTYPDLFDVRVTAGLKFLYASILNDTTFTECVGAIHDDPKLMSMSEQASRFRYVVHVEGNAGWSDRLKHLMLSGALVLKQASGVTEFFEPLLKPWQHYVPVSSTLHNLSRAVRWARDNSGAAARIASSAAALIEEIMSSTALAVYMEELFLQYARRHFDWGPFPDRLWQERVNSTARFACEREPHRSEWPPNSVIGADAIRCSLERLADGSHDSSMRHVVKPRTARHAV